MSAKSQHPASPLLVIIAFAIGLPGLGFNLLFYSPRRAGPHAGISPRRNTIYYCRAAVDGLVPYSARKKYL